MISNNLVKFEYDVFQQIKEQLKKKTNALFLICKQLAKAFVQTYSKYTLGDTSKMDKKQAARKTRQLKNEIQDLSLMIRKSNTGLLGHQSQLPDNDSFDIDSSKHDSSEVSFTKMLKKPGD